MTTAQECTEQIDRLQAIVVMLEGARDRMIEEYDATNLTEFNDFSDALNMVHDAITSTIKTQHEIERVHRQRTWDAGDWAFYNLVFENCD